MWSGVFPKSEEAEEKALPGPGGPTASLPLSSRMSEEYCLFADESLRQQPGGSQVHTLVNRLPDALNLGAGPASEVQSTCHIGAPPATPPGREFYVDVGVEKGLFNKPPLQAPKSHLQMEKTMRRSAGHENPLEYYSEIPLYSQSRMFKTLEHGDHVLTYDVASSLRGSGETFENISRDSCYGRSVLKQRIHAILMKHNSVLWSELPVLYKQTFSEDLPEAVLTYLDKWTDICRVKIFGSGNSASDTVMLTSDSRLQMYNNAIDANLTHPREEGFQRNFGNMVNIAPPQSLLRKKSQPQSPLNDVLKKQLTNLLKDHPSGIWLKCLARLYFEKYKQRLPETIVEKYEYLSEIFDINRPLQNNPNNVILNFPDISDVTVAPAALPKTKFAFGKISLVKDCEEFYIQFETDFLKNDLKSISTMLRDQYANDKKELADFLEGMFCSFEVSNNWYRGQIQSVDEREASAVVFAIDYGFTTSCVRTQICKLPPLCARHPAQCARCRLRPIAAHGTRWTRSAVAQLRALKERLKVQVDAVKEDFAVVVLYTEDGACLNERLCVQIPCLALFKGDTVFVSFVTAESTDKVIVRCCRGEYACRYQELTSSMNLFYGANKGRAPSFTVDELVAVNAEGRGWLRASVASLSADHVVVMCIDLNLLLEVKKSDARELEETFCDQPVFALACQLAGLEHFCRDKAVLNCLCSMTRDHLLHLEVVKENPKPLVVLYDHSNVNINASCLKALEDSHLALEFEVNVTYRNVCIQHVTTDGMLFCQMKTNVVKKVSKILSEIEKREVLLEPVPYVFSGMQCLIRHLGTLIRVEVLSVQDEDVVEVYITDYGKTVLIQTSNLFKICAQHVKDLVEIPAQVVKCRLAGAGMEHVVFTAEVLHGLQRCVAERHNCVVKVVSVDSATFIKNIYLFIKDGRHFEETVNYMISRAFSSSSNVEPSPSNENVESFQQECAIGKNSNDGTEPPALRDEEQVAFQKPMCAALAPNPSQLPGNAVCGASALQQQQEEEEQEALPPLQSLPLGEIKQVYVSAAYLPNHFVLQFNRELSSLDHMMNEMGQYYRRSPQPAIDVQIRKIYAAKCEDGRFYRVVVKNMVSGMASVYQLDYGQYSLVSVDSILPLPITFKTLPIQGVRAELFGDIPDRKWSVEATKFFTKQVMGRILWAQFIKVHEDPDKPLKRKVCVDLIDTVPDKDVYISQVMLDF